jgi:hypothetical protein
VSPTLTILTACDHAAGTIVRACTSMDGQRLPEGLRIGHLRLDGASTDGTLERHYDAKRLEAGMRGKLSEAFEANAMQILSVLEVSPVHGCPVIFFTCDGVMAFGASPATGVRAARDAIACVRARCLRIQRCPCE